MTDNYVNGTWQNPYQTEKVLAVSPSLEFYEGKNLQVILPLNLWQTNAAQGELIELDGDFNDGLGYRTIYVDQPLLLNYADTGIKVWNYRLRFSNGQYLYSHSQVKIKNAIVETGCAGCRFGNTPREVLPQFTADEAFQGAVARGFVTIQYRDPDLGLRRPLIVVEGFDAGHITSPELRFGSNTIVDFYNNVNFNNSSSADLDNVIRNFPEYDIIYVDWRNGTDFLQRNGLLLETIIRWVNNNKEQLPGGGFADNVILGQSMGGVISRWALRDMETRLGQQHHTRMYISMDAPHQGANVPAAYQHLARHARDLYLQTNVWGMIELFQFFTRGPSPLRALSIADRPASRQMLINYVNGSGNIDNTVHDQWENELRILGYPNQNNIRNIAISNGAECGTTQPFAPGAELLNLNGKANTRFLGDIIGQVAFPLVAGFLNWNGFYLGILPGRNNINYEFIANAQPPQGVTQRIYRGKISYTKRILWIIPVTSTITERNNNSNPNLLPTDYYAGGEINTGININNINFQNALVKFNLNFSHIPTFCFIPTPSALDIGLNNIVLDNNDYLARYIGGAPPAAPRNTPFQNFVTAFNNQRRNEQHIGFFQRNGNWLAQELTQVGNPPPNQPIVNCSEFCNLQIAGDGPVCTPSQFSVPVTVSPTTTVTWSAAPAGLVQFSCNTCAQTTVTQTGNGTVTLTANITSNCGNFTVTRGNIVVGAPSVSISSRSGYCSGTYQTWFLSAEPTSYGTNWQWYVDYLSEGSDIYIDNPNSPFTNVDVSGFGTVRLTYTDLCGAVRTDGVTVYSNCGGGYAYTLAPNPTSGDLQVSSTNKKTNIKEIRVTDKTGTIKKHFIYSQNINSVKIDISSLPPDIYYIQIFDGKKWTSKAISKK
ncbi:MAG: T9SS type A sorting domain-containing protein [Chitinophagaceae bacterium]